MTKQNLCRAFVIFVFRMKVPIGLTWKIYCQVENLVVGAPCGVMDQMASACGEANKLLAMVCQVCGFTYEQNAFHYRIYFPF